MKIVKLFYKLRFIIFLSIQLLILFGTQIIPKNFNEQIFTPILFLINILAGINLLSKRKFFFWFFVIQFLILLAILGLGYSLVVQMDNLYSVTRFALYFIFYIIIFVETISQVLTTKYVDKSLIIGLMSGYITLGFLGFFSFISIELLNPGAFQGIYILTDNFYLEVDKIMYFSFITILGIGYGEIVPIIPLAQKVAILIGLCGQFYMVIVMAVVIEKYIRNTTSND